MPSRPPAGRPSPLDPRTIGEHDVRLPQSRPPHIPARRAPPLTHSVVRVSAAAPSGRRRPPHARTRRSTHVIALVVSVRGRVPDGTGRPRHGDHADAGHVRVPRWLQTAPGSGSRVLSSLAITTYSTPATQTVRRRRGSTALKCSTARSADGRFGRASGSQMTGGVASSPWRPWSTSPAPSSGSGSP